MFISVSLGTMLLLPGLREKFYLNFIIYV